MNFFVFPAQLRLYLKVDNFQRQPIPHGTYSSRSFLPAINFFCTINTLQFIYIYYNYLYILYKFLQYICIFLKYTNNTLSSLSSFLFHSQQYNSHHFLSIFLIFKIIKTSFYPFIYSLSYFIISYNLELSNLIIHIHQNFERIFLRIEKRQKDLLYTIRQTIV